MALVACSTPALLRLWPAVQPAMRRVGCRWVLQPADCSEPAAMTSGVRKAWAAVFQPKASEVKSRKRRTPAANE
jgi:hypothetical protein